MRLAVILFAVLLGIVSGPAFGETIYGPLTFETGDQGGTYYTYGPDNYQVDLSFPGSPDAALRIDPTGTGASLVYDTGFATTLSTYTISADCVWDANNRDRFSILGYAVPGSGGIGVYQYKDSSGNTSYVTSLYDETNPLNNAAAEHVEDWTSGGGYKIACFKAAQQAAGGDGISDMDWSNPHSIMIEIADTGVNSTSTFTYTWSQVVGEYTNTWVVEETFADIRDYAIGEAATKELANPGITAHVGDLFDSLVAKARSGSETTGFCYVSFSGSDAANWDNTTVTAVPEPSCMVLVLCSLAMLVGIRGRKTS